MVANPPYGERIGELDEAGGVLPAAGIGAEKTLGGLDCFFFTGDLRLSWSVSSQPQDAAVQRAAGMPFVRVPHGGGSNRNI